MLEIKISAAGRNVDPADLSSILGARRAYVELGDMIEALIAQMDILAGDCDLEEAGDLEPDGDAFGDVAWIEWDGRGPQKMEACGSEAVARLDMFGLLHEDDEEDDWPEEDDEPGVCDEDGVNVYADGHRELDELAHARANFELKNTVPDYECGPIFSALN